MSLDHSILAVIGYRPCTGYDIKNEFEHKGAGLYWGISFGSIYPRLRKLEEEGLIEAQETESGGRQKKIYDLTAKGWSELEAWMRSSSEYPSVKDELLVKMFSWIAALPEDRSTLIRHLESRKAKSEELLDYVKKWPSNNFSSISEYGMLAINHLRARLETDLKWIDESIRQLEGEPQPPVQDPFDLISQQPVRRKTAFNKSNQEEKDNG